MIGLKNSRHFFIQSRVKPKPVVPRWHQCFPALCVSYRHLLRIVIGLLNCLCPLLLARMIPLVLRHLTVNRSISTSKIRNLMSRVVLPSPWLHTFKPVILNMSFFRQLNSTIFEGANCTAFQFSKFVWKITRTFQLYTESYLLQNSRS